MKEQVRRDKSGIEFKRQKDLVTQVDKKAEPFIIDAGQKEYPGMASLVKKPVNQMSMPNTSGSLNPLTVPPPVFTAVSVSVTRHIDSAGHICHSWRQDFIEPFRDCSTNPTPGSDEWVLSRIYAIFFYAFFLQ